MLGKCNASADLYRGLARARLEAFTPELATSLNTLANVLPELGRREEALTAAQEAVGLCQSNDGSTARGATRPPRSGIQAARARHSANAIERLCL